MKENVGEKLSQILAGAKLGKSAGGLLRLLDSPEGQKLKSSLSDSDKKAILEKFMSMDADEVSKKLKNADMSKLADISAEDIMKKLR